MYLRQQSGRIQDVISKRNSHSDAIYLRQLAGRLQDEHLVPLERQWHAHRVREQEFFRVNA